MIKLYKNIVLGESVTRQMTAACCGFDYDGKLYCCVAESEEICAAETAHIEETHPKSAHVVLSPDGWRQLDRLNSRLGKEFVRAVDIINELRTFFFFHSDSPSGNDQFSLDRTCQTLRIDGGLYVNVMKAQGIWVVIDIWMDERARDNMRVSFSPVYIWRRALNKLSSVCRRLVACWSGVYSADPYAV